MFETVELGRRVTKRDYEAQLPELRAGLLDAQVALRKAQVPVVVVFSGANGSGKSETVQRLYQWLDPRGLETNAFGASSDEERERPGYWRFWRTLPPRGHIERGTNATGIWNTGLLVEGVTAFCEPVPGQPPECEVKVPKARFPQAAQHIEDVRGCSQTY